MIAYIKGSISYKSPTEIIIDVQGIGYQIFISLYTYSKIQHLNEVKLITHLHIKEDGHSLYGFFDTSEKEIFMQLISVSGVGLATARLMLSSLSPIDIYNTITQSKTHILEKVKGIGKKTAERIILELKDKLLKIKNVPSNKNTETSFDNSTSVISKQDNEAFEIQNDAISALIALGIARSMAEISVQQVIKKTDDKNNLETLIKLSLQNISSL